MLHFFFFLNNIEKDSRKREKTKVTKGIPDNVTKNLVSALILTGLLFYVSHVYLLFEDKTTC